MGVTGQGTTQRFGAGRAWALGSVPPATGFVELVPLPFALYRLVLAERSSSGLGTPIIDDVFGEIGLLEGTTPLRWTDELNGWGSIEVTLPIDHPLVTKANFARGQRELHLYRDVGDGEVLVWGGKLWLERVRGWAVTFIGYGWFYDLSRREMGTEGAPDFSMIGADTFDIIRAAVDDTQSLPNGGLGITFWDTGELSGVLRRVIVCFEERRPVADLIRWLAGARDGFDFAVMPDKTLTLWHPRRGVSKAIVFDGLSNLGDFGYEGDASELANHVVVVGPQEDCHIPTTHTEYDQASLDTYGLLQASRDLQHVHDDEFRTARALELLRVSKDPLREFKLLAPSALPGAEDLLDYEVGDTIKIKTTRGPADGFGYVDTTARIVSRTVSVAVSGLESVEVDAVEELTI